MHPYELPQIHYTVVRVAKGQMGIGGDDSWGAYTHPEYLLNQTERWNSPLAFKRNFNIGFIYFLEKRGAVGKGSSVRD
mgnify:CR=1 FL=1